VIDPRKAQTRSVAPGIRLLDGERGARLEGPATTKEAESHVDIEMTMAAWFEKKPMVRRAGAEVGTTPSIDRAPGLDAVSRTGLIAFTGGSDEKEEPSK
jgi:hypothetical protein